MASKAEKEQNQKRQTIQYFFKSALQQINGKSEFSKEKQSAYLIRQVI